MKKFIGTLTIACLLLPLNALANASGTVAVQAQIDFRGTIADETGAYLPAAPVVLEDGKGTRLTTQTDEQGRFLFANLKPGIYRITVEVEGFAPFAEEVNLTRRPTGLFEIILAVFIEEEVDVREDSAAVSTEPDKNLSAITLSEKELEALPDDPDELLETLRQMAGAGGAGEAAVYVGGFRERGRIPPKEAIQMIRINSNPFAAEYSEPGHSRIEIVTKPGSDTYRGGLRFTFNDEALNARSAFAPTRAPLQVRTYGGNFSGPIIKNRWGFFFDFDRREEDENSVINATILNPTTFLPEAFSDSALKPSRRTNFSIRSDFLVTNRHTIGAQYRFFQNNQSNQGLDGGFDLPERGFNRTTREDTLRFSLTTIATERAVNEFRVQLTRRSVDSRAVTDSPAFIVFDAFNAGGNQGQLLVDNNTDNVDFTNNLTYTYKKHTFKFGSQVEGSRQENINQSNFGGTWTFGSDFERNALGLPVLDAGGSPISISPLELYRRVVTGVPGYRPTQFSIVTGDPLVSITQWEMSWFMQDDWRVSNAFTFSYGFRHEFQTHLGDRMNFAPRIGIAWAPDKARKSTVRVGAGIFYDRVGSGITFDTFRLDGQRQRQFVVPLPGFFPLIPDAFDGFTAREPTIRVKDGSLNAPYAMVSTVSYERQLPANVFASVGYTWRRGVHLLRSRNVNAPVFEEGSPNGVLPFPDQGPILQFESTGLSTRHEMFVGFRTNINPRFMLFGRYTLASTRSDTDSSYSTPASSYDLSTEWGRSSMDSRHNLFLAGRVSLPWQVTISPFITANTGRPFNITTGRDNNRDTLFSDRPSFAQPGDPEAITTAFGTFNPNPGLNDTIIPRNFGQGPGSLGVNLSVSKTFGFGTPRGSFQSQGGDRGGNRGSGGQQASRGQSRGGFGGFGGGGPMVQRGGGGGGRFGGMFGGSQYRYTMILSVTAQNVLNRTNLAGFNGVLTSSLFGTANRSFQPRRVEVSLRFMF